MYTISQALLFAVVNEVILLYKMNRGFRRTTSPWHYNHICHNQYLR
uniref:Uncharacterized protein n=1 Tax=Anguilla anguilla TaxID=7936 RepID=A0A0E9UZX3_ANGAN